MRVDLYTDAGVRSDGLATWATVAIVEGQEKPIEAFGRLRAGTNCSATAECRAIANALHRLAVAGHLPPGCVVRIYSDSRHAVDRIEGRLKRRPESGMAKAVAVILALRDKRALSLRAFWVPGHKPDDHSPHAKWNNRCDVLCREARKLPPPASPRIAQRRKPSSYRAAPRP